MEESDNSTLYTQSSSYFDSSTTFDPTSTSPKQNDSQISKPINNSIKSSHRRIFQFSFSIFILAYAVQLYLNRAQLFKPIRHWGYQAWWWNLIRFHSQILGKSEPYNLLFSPQELNTSYDFIIIGGGASGSVVASGLSDKAGEKVLLLEAGGPHPNILSRYNIPAIVNINQGTEADWKYITESQRNANKVLNVNKSKWPSGKGLGGSSLINFMLWVRGAPSDYDSWAAQGAKGWSFSEILPYFKKIERVIGIPFIFDKIYRSTNGKIPITRPHNLRSNEQDFLSAALELGYEYNDDYNSKRLAGASILQTNILKGARMTPFKTYISQGKPKFDTLDVLPYAHVTKINFDENNNVESVSFAFYPPKNKNKETEIHRVTVNKEVILSAGCIKSPQILMLSGIGPKQDLDKLNINLVANLPGVGKNLQDHLVSLWPAKSKPGTNLTKLNFLNPINLVNYLFYGSGPFATSGCVVQLITQGFDKNYKFQPFEIDPSNNKSQKNTSNDEYNQPDLQIILYSGVILASVMSENFNLSNNINKLWSEEANIDKLYDSMIIFLPVLLHPRSRGRISLRSSDPMIPPEIQPNYLSHPRDLEILAKGLEISWKLTQTSAFKNSLSDPIKIICKEGNIPEIKELCNMSGTTGTEQFFKTWAQHFSLTLYHPIGTCKMGNSKDFDETLDNGIDDTSKNITENVVDENLLVCGGKCVKGLRIVDASIMPDLPSGNTHAPAIMIAEKAVDIIKEYWFK